MIRIEELKLDLNYTEDELKQRILSALRIDEEELRHYTVVRKAIDARRKPEIFYVLTVDAEVTKEKHALSGAGKARLSHVDPVRYHFPKSGSEVLKVRPVVIGSGPCGLLCAYELALHGYRPILLERGSDVETRSRCMEHFWQTGELAADNNAQFGEGGAGTFSDGKLTTSVRDPLGRNREVLEFFVRMGADSAILSDAKPHIGTDGLKTVLKNARGRIRELGGTVRFDACVTDFYAENGRLTGIEINAGERLDTEVAVLAIGHSARDTFRVLCEKGLVMEAKPFAAGFRIEHPQTLIDLCQYGRAEREGLPAAIYRLAAKSRDGRGVYSFCMCPGGYVVNASSKQGELCVNGMSYAARDGANANSAIVVQVGPGDYPGSDALAGMRFQEELERKACTIGQGMIPQQLLGDFKDGRISGSYGEFPSAAKGRTAFADLNALLPEAMRAAFLEGIRIFGDRMKGFDRGDAILSGIESRTSSPVRILRNEDGVSSLEGLYPAGEGAGYAGGIVSAAIDGIRAAEAVARRFQRGGS